MNNTLNKKLDALIEQRAAEFAAKFADTDDAKIDEMLKGVDEILHGVAEFLKDAIQAACDEAYKLRLSEGRKENHIVDANKLVEHLRDYLREQIDDFCERMGGMRAKKIPGLHNSYGAGSIQGHIDAFKETLEELERIAPSPTNRG